MIFYCKQFWIKGEMAVEVLQHVQTVDLISYLFQRHFLSIEIDRPQDFVFKRILFRIQYTRHNQLSKHWPFMQRPLCIYRRSIMHT